MAVNLFSIGRSGLGASKKALQTTSHNIANANTEGFSRQRITQETSIPIGSGKHVLGSGTDVREVKRVHDELIEKKLNTSIADNKYHEERTYQLSRIEEVFNEVNSDGLNKIMGRFFNSFRELANQPENETVRAIVRDNARLVVKDFHRINETLINIKEQMDSKISNSVKEINSFAQTVANLNREIVRLEVAGGETGDLRDQRDMAVSQLAEYFELKTYQNEKGQYVVNIEGVGSLVSGANINKLAAKKISGGDSSQEGRVEVFFEARPKFPVSARIHKGTLAAQIESRNEDLKELRDEINTLASGLAQATNAIHKRGYINVEIPVDQAGNPIRGSRPITGIDFFKWPIELGRAAETIDLSSEVKADLNNITTGLEPNAPGDNRISLAISKLQHEKVLSGGHETFEENYHKSVGKIGLRAGKSKIDMEQSSGILAQAKSIKERISGVSLDEESANLIKYQHAYEANARVIRAADEMFDSVIGMMR